MSNTKTYIQMGAQVVDADLVSKPANRDFRDAWQLDGNVIEVDMVRARDIHRDRLRAERADKFSPLDVEASQKMIAGDTAGAQAAEAKRQTLRDVTADARIDAASTPQGLAALTLEILIPA